MLLFGIINVGITFWLNIWNRDFFNALEKRDTSMLVEQLYILAAIVVSGGVAVAIHLHIRRRLQINWRSWLTQVTTRRWLHAGRQYQIGLLANELDNPDGRIAEDVRVSTLREYIEALGGTLEMSARFGDEVIPVDLSPAHNEKQQAG